MAIDNTPPRIRLIVTIAVIVIVTLFSLNFVFESYYAYMSDEAQRAKLAPTTDRDEHHKAEAASLTAANVDKTMAGLAQGARPEIVAPKQSDDTGALTGWSKMPKPLPTSQGAAPSHETHAADAGAVEGDGGATATGDAGAAAGKDGGAAPAAQKDGGAPAQKKDAGH